jgi:hypothetical protein
MTKKNESLEGIDKKMRECFEKLNERGRSLTNPWVIDRLAEKFQALGYAKFHERALGVDFFDNQQKRTASSQGFLKNDVCTIMIFSIMYLEIDYVPMYIRLLETIRANMDSFNERHPCYGAIYARIIHPDAEGYALSQGFYLIEASDKDLAVTPPLWRPRGY